jgi:uncharacterized protein
VSGLALRAREDGVRPRRLSGVVARPSFPRCSTVFDGPTFTFEDERFAHAERRFMTLGFLGGLVVSIVHTETPRVIRVISFRKATRREEAILFESLKD